MEVIQIRLKEAARITEAQFRQYTLPGDPVLFVVSCATVPFCMLFFAPPWEHLWTFTPRRELLPPDPFDGEANNPEPDTAPERKLRQERMQQWDQQLNSILKKELSIAGVSRLPYGLFSLADSFDKSDPNIDSVLSCLGGISIHSDDLGKTVAFMEQWWSAFGSEILVEFPGGSIDRNKNFGSSTIHWLLSGRWWIPTHEGRNGEPLKSAPAFFEEAIRDLSCGKEILTRQQEAMGMSLFPGNVARDAVIITYKPNKRFEKQLGSEHLIPEITLRDNLFSMQARLVNLLDRLSMYWNVGEAIKKYQYSLMELPIQGSPKFNAFEELQAYQERMKNRYPILAGINLNFLCALDDLLYAEKQKRRMANTHL